MTGGTRIWACPRETRERGLLARERRIGGSRHPRPHTLPVYTGHMDDICQSRGYELPPSGPHYGPIAVASLLAPCSIP